MNEQANNVAGNKKDEDDIQKISLLHLLFVVRRKIGLVILFALLGLCASIVYLDVTIPVYSATATIMVDPISSNASSIDTLLTTTSSATNISTEVNLITSKKTLKNAISLLDLDKYKDAGGILYSQKNLANSNLSGRVSVSTVKDTKIVTITVTDQNPQFCADFANAITASYYSMLSEIAKNSKTAQREFLEEQIPITESLLNAASDALTSYRESSGVIQMSEKSSILTKNIATYQLLTEPLNLQLIEDQSIINDLYNALEGLPSLEDVSKNEQVKAILEEYKSNDTELIMYANLEDNANASRVYVLESALSAKEKEILEIVNSMGSTSSAAYSKAVADYLCVEAKISVLANMEEVANVELSEYPVLERTLQELERDVQIYESLLLKLREMLEEAKTLEASIVGNVTLVDEAQVSGWPVSPNRTRILTFGIFGGFVVGILFVILMALLDSSIQDEDDVKLFFGSTIPLLGWTYYLKNLSSVKKEVPGLVVYNSPGSMFAERFVSIANNIIYSTPNKLQVVSINSTEMNEGKTSVVCNVAASYAMVGKKVLIIDSDFRKPAVESFFNLKTSKLGLVDAVVTGIPLEQCIFQPFSDLPNLHILPPGRGTRNPNALFSSSAFSEVLMKLRRVYDYILIDSPPLSYGSEFANLAKNIDGYILNIRAGVTTRNSLYSFIQNMSFLQAPIIGYIFYDVIPGNHSIHGIGSSSYYGYGSYYGNRHRYYYYYSSSKKASDSLYEPGSGSYHRIYKKEIKARSHRHEGRAGFEKKPGKLAFANGLEGAFGAPKPSTEKKASNNSADKTLDMLSEIEADYKNLKK